jgi:cytochrome P450
LPLSNSDVTIHITEPGFFTQPDYYDVLKRLRTEAPVFNSEPNTWLVTRYDDIRAISRDTERFTSQRGVLVNDPARAADASAPEGSMLHMDPPQHSDYRRIVSREFTPRATGQMADQVAAITKRVFDELSAGETVDFVERVAMPIPVMVIAELLGVGDAQLADFHRWSDAMIAVTDDPQPETFASVMEFMTFLNAHIAERATHPRDDLVSMLVASELTTNEVLLFCLTLLVAGNETTRHLLSGGTYALSEHPDQRSAIADMGDAVEELLRWVTPIQAFGRTASTPVDIGGVTLEAGDFAVLLYASGNRDEAVFGPSAGTLDVARSPSPTHVAFGFGEHNCLGAPLARLEARTVFTELLTRFPNYEAAAPTLVDSTLVRGASHMEVVLR